MIAFILSDSFLFLTGFFGIELSIRFVNGKTLRLAIRFIVLGLRLSLESGNLKTLISLVNEN